MSLGCLNCKNAAGLRGSHVVPILFRSPLELTDLAVSHRVDVKLFSIIV